MMTGPKHAHANHSALANSICLRCEASGGTAIPDASESNKLAKSGTEIHTAARLAEVGHRNCIPPSFIFTCVEAWRNT